MSSNSSDVMNKTCTYTCATFSDAQYEQITKMIKNIMKTFGGPWNTSASQLSGKIYSASSYNAYIVQTKSASNWIFDFGATDHIVSDVMLLCDPKPISSVLDLPYSTTIPVTHIGM